MKVTVSTKNQYKVLSLSNRRALKRVSHLNRNDNEAPWISPTGCEFVDMVRTTIPCAPPITPEFPSYVIVGNAYIGIVYSDKHHPELILRKFPRQFLPRRGFSFRTVTPTVPVQPQSTFGAISDHCDNIDDFMSQWKITSTIGHIRSFLATKHRGLKFAYLICICENFQSSGTLATAHKLISHVHLITPLFKSLLNWFHSKTHALPPLPQETLVQESASLPSTIDLSKDVSDQFDWPQTWLPIIRIVAGLLLTVAIMCGFSTLIRFDFFANLEKETSRIAKLINGKNTIRSEVKSVTDDLLTMVYSAFGETYYTEKEGKLLSFSQDIAALDKDVYTYIEGLRTDFFGIVLNDTLPSIIQRHADLMERYNLISASDTNSQSFALRLSEIKTNITSIRQRKTAITKANTGKQEPVKIWIAGKPYVGKTVLVSELWNKIRPGAPLYTRTKNDAYHSGYVQQPGYFIDDMLQDASSDVAEWHAFSTTNAVDTVGASLTDKGQPFLSQFMFATSNSAYLLDSTRTGNLESFNRRRDFLVYATNEKVAEYKRVYGGVPNSDWFAQNPTEYYLLEPTAPHDHGDGDLNRPFDLEHPWVYGKVTIEELAEMITEKELYFREIYRQRLAESQIPEIVIPTEPFPYRPEIFDPVRRFRGHRITQQSINELLDDAFSSDESSPSSPPSSPPSSVPSVSSNSSLSPSPSSRDEITFMRPTLTQIKCPSSVLISTSGKHEACWIRCVTRKFQTDDIKEKLLATDTWYLPEVMEVALPELKKCYTARVKGDVWNVLQVAALHDSNLCVHKDNATESTLYSLGFKKTVCVHYSSASLHYSAMEYAPSVFHPQKTSFSPDTIISHKRRAPVILLGPCGIGKTVLINEAFDESNLYTVPPEILLSNDWFNAICNTAGDRVVFIDDVTTSATRFDKFRELALAYESCTIHFRGLLATANPDTPCWRGDSAQQLIRRCVIPEFRINASWLQWVYTKFVYTGSVEKILGDLDTAARTERVSIIDSGIPVKGFASFATIAASLREHFAKEMTVKESKRVGCFTIPMPPDAEVLLTISRAFSDLEGLPAAQILSLPMQAVKLCPNRQFRPLSKSELLTLGLEVGKLIKSSYARGTLQNFVSSFNSEQHAHVLTYHGVVRFNDGAIGFVSTPDKTSTICYLVDPNAPNDFEFIGDQILYKKKAIVFTRGNDHYKHVVRTLFNTTPRVISPITPEEEKREIREIAFSDSKLAVFCYNLIPILSLLVKGAAISIMAASLFTAPRLALNSEGNWYGSDDEEEDEPYYHDAGVLNAGRNAIYDTSRTYVAPKENFTVTKGYDRAPKYQQHDSDFSVSKGHRNEPKHQHYGGDEDDVRPPTPSGSSVNKKSRGTHVPESVDLGLVVAKLNKLVNMETSALANIENAMVITKSKQFGIIYNGQIATFTTIARGSYVLSLVPITPEWEEVDISKFPRTIKANGKPYSITIKQKLADTPALISFFEKTIAVGEHNTVNYNSVFAFMFAFGIPIDAEKGTLEPNAVLPLFRNSGCRIPGPLAVYLRGVFPLTHAQLLATYSVKKEGMTDPSFCEFQTSLAPNSINIVDQHDRLIVCGMVVSERYMLTVAHIPDIPLFAKMRDGRRVSFKVLGRSKSKDLAFCELDAKDTEGRPVSNFPSIVNKFVTTNHLSKLLSMRTENIAVAMSVPVIGTYLSVYTQFASMEARVICTNTTSGPCGVYYTSLSNLGVSGVSKEGDCGSPIILQDRTTHGKICGIHRAGSSQLSTCSYVTKEWIEKALLNLTCLPEETAIGSLSPDEVIPEGAQERRIHPVRNHHLISLLPVVRKDVNTGLDWVGTTPKPVFVPDTTRICRTGIRLPEWDIFEPSLMSTKDPRNPSSHLFTGLNRYSKISQCSLPQDKINEVFGLIGNELATMLQSQQRTIRVLKKTEALNTPFYYEYANANPLDRSGSAGFPSILSTPSASKKSDFLIFNEEQEKWYFNKSPEAQRISSNVDLLIQDAANGISQISPFTAYLKDEPLKKKKIYEVPKTRVFFSCPFDYLLAYRMYFSAAMLRVQEFHHLHPIKVGISNNCQDWHRLAHSLQKVSNTGFASDVANFDSSIAREFLVGVNVVYSILYTECSPTGENVDRDNMIREVLHRSVEGAYVLSRNKLYKLRGAQVSGCPGTAFENSLILWALYYLVWEDLANKYCPSYANYTSFRKYVGLAVYGDDNVCTVSHKCPWFNFNSFKVSAQKFGFEITDIAKSGDQVPDFVPFTELEFLKRNFVLTQGWWTGVLAKESIFKAFHWVRSHKPYRVTAAHVPQLGGEWPVNDDMEVLQDLLEGMWGELALHGKDFYNKITKEVLKQLKHPGLVVSVPTWKTAMQKQGYYVHDGIFNLQSLSSSLLDSSFCFNNSYAVKREKLNMDTSAPPQEVGTVTATPLASPEQVPDNPKTIVQTTSIENVQHLMYNDWIYRNTYTIDPSMQPGHVFGYIKIHPMNCHAYLTHIAQMFLTWVGHMKIRCRFMANFTNGGSFRVGYLPPNFKEADLATIDLTTLSAYPSVDMDPKDTTWKHFKSVDERNVAFHWMKPLSDESIESFGGWITFYVVGSLVQTLNTAGSVQLVVESAGGFEFMQPASLSGNGPSPVDKHPLANATTSLTLPGCDDKIGDVVTSFIQICASTTRNLPAGFGLASAPGGLTPAEYGGHLTNIEADYYKDVKEGRSCISPSAYLQCTVNNEWVPYFDASPIFKLPLNIAWPDHMMEATTSGGAAMSPSPTERTHYLKPPFLDPAGLSVVHWHINNYTGSSNDTVVTDCAGHPLSYTPINVATVGVSDTNPSFIPNLVPNESIVLFCNSRLRSINIQTEAMAQAILENRPSAQRPQTSYVYALRSTDTSGPILLLRLQPNGMFSCAPTATDTIIRKPTGARLYLEFVQELPLATPLPPLAGTSSFLRKAARATRAVLGGTQVDLAMQVNLWNALAY